MKLQMNLFSSHEGTAEGSPKCSQGLGTFMAVPYIHTICSSIIHSYNLSSPSGSPAHLCPSRHHCCLTLCSGRWLAGRFPLALVQGERHRSPPQGSWHDHLCNHNHWPLPSLDLVTHHHLADSTSLASRATFRTVSPSALLLHAVSLQVGPLLLLIFLILLQPLLLLLLLL